jgi:hypothetical protein
MINFINFAIGIMMLTLPTANQVQTAGTAWQTAKTQLDNQCPKGPSNLVITSWKWGTSGYVLLSYVPATLELKIKNTGDKTITSITYMILILDGLRDYRIKDRLTFTTDDKSVKPNEERKLRKKFDYYTNHRDKARLFVLRVQYDNGTIWTNPCDKPS